MEKFIKITTCIECPYYHKRSREIWPQDSGGYGFFQDHTCTIKEPRLLKRINPHEDFDGKIPNDCPL